MIFIGVRISTHLLLKDSQQKGEWSLGAASYRGWKQTEWNLQLSSHIFSRTDLRNKADEKSMFRNFFISKPHKYAEWVVLWIFQPQIDGPGPEKHLSFVKKKELVF